MTDDAERFERWLDRRHDPDGRGFRAALVDVLDTAKGVTLWFADRELQPSAADIVAMTALVLAQEIEQERRQDRDHLRARDE